MKTIVLKKRKDLFPRPHCFDNAHLIVRDMDLFINPDFTKVIELYDQNRMNEIKNSMKPKVRHHYHIYINKDYEGEQLQALYRYVKWVNDDTWQHVNIHVPHDNPELKDFMDNHFTGLSPAYIHSDNPEMPFTFFVDSGGKSGFKPGLNTYIHLFWVPGGMEMSFLNRHRRY